MPPDSLPWLIVLNAAIELVGLILLAVITVRGLHELPRIDRAIAGLVMQEEEKTRAEIRAVAVRR